MRHLITILVLAAVVCTIAVPAALARRGTHRRTTTRPAAAAIARSAGGRALVRLDHPAFRPTYFVRR